VVSLQQFFLLFFLNFIFRGAAGFLVTHALVTPCLVEVDISDRTVWPAAAN
jgi:hypothetical protein